MANPPAGDDYYDPYGQRVLWGDSTVGKLSPFTKFLLVSDASFATSTGNYLYQATATAASEDFSLTALYPDGDGPVGDLNPHTRLGVRRMDATGDQVADVIESYYVWWFDTAADLYTARLNHNITGDVWTWEDKSDAYDVGNFSGAAIHPISDDEAVIVAYEDPYIWVQYVRKVRTRTDETWPRLFPFSTTGWKNFDPHVVHMTDNIIWSDCHWSDAEFAPLDMYGDVNNSIVVVLNMSEWGSLMTLNYNKKNDMWSQPTEVLPSTEQWGNLRAWCSGLSVINGRIWGVTVREPVGSGDIPFAHHVALVSTVDGVNWRDEDFVTTSTLRGKLLYKGGEDYCYVVGNVSVARGDATNKLGYDHPDLKYVVDEAFSVSLVYSGPSTVPEMVIMAVNDDDELVDSGLVETETEVTLELGAEGYEYGQVSRTLLATPSREEGSAHDVIELASVGHSNRILGADSYRPIAARLYDGPYYNYSQFEFPDSGLPRLTVRQVSGLWTNTEVPDVGRHVLHCKKPGISLIPHSTSRQDFLIRTTFLGVASVEGVWFVFWHEDEENYWRAGVKGWLLGGDIPYHAVYVEKISDGETTEIVYYPCDDRLEADTWYSMMLQIVPGRIDIMLNESDSYDFSAPTVSTYYLTTAESEGPPQTYHVGLMVDGYDEWDGAYITGAVTDADYNNLESTTTWFSATRDQGMFVRCNEQDRRITTVMGHQIYTAEPWGEEPSPGDTFGLYNATTIEGPGAQFRELWFCEGIKPWTIDEVANAMIELAGVSVSSVYTGTSVGVLSGIFPSGEGMGKVMGDVHGTFRQNTDATSLALWASSRELTGDNAWSGLRIEVDQTNDVIRLYNVTVGSETLLAAHPALMGIPKWSTQKSGGTKGEWGWEWDFKWNVYATDGLIVVTGNNRFLTAFPVVDVWRGGYVGRLTAGEFTITEFPYVLDSFIWDSNEPAQSALARLLEGRRAKIVERYDGTVAISRFDNALDNLGVYDAEVITSGNRWQMGQEYSLVEMAGAEERAFHINIDTAVKKLKYIRADNSALETQIEALNEALHYLNLVQARHVSGNIRIYAPDPVVEMEDMIEIDGQAYIIESFTYNLAKSEDGTPTVDIDLIGRLAPEAIVTGEWGNDDELEIVPEFHYDGGTEYG